MLKGIFVWMKSHFVWSAIIVLGIGYGSYSVYQKLNPPVEVIRYTLTKAEKGTLVITTSGSGQVSAQNQIDLKSKASGDFLASYATNGQTVKAGALIIQLNASDALKAVRDAQTSYETAQLSLDKIKQPTDAVSMLSSQNSLASAEDSLSRTKEDLVKAYDDGFTNVANAFIDLPTVMTSLNDILYGNTFTNGPQQNIDAYTDSVKNFDPSIILYRNDAEAAYNKARADYDQNALDFKTASRQDPPEKIETLIEETYNTARSISESAKAATNLIQHYKDKTIEQGRRASAVADTHINALNTDTSSCNSNLSSLLSVKQTITNDIQSIASTERDILQKRASLEKLQTGSDPLDIRSAEVNLASRWNALADARSKLADYSVRAPFDGIITKMTTKKGDSIGSGTAVATLITKQKVAEISLNEVDAAKVKLGDRATLTFDAVPDLQLTGSVIDMDQIGTVSQGVVSYNVKISFDTDDERVLPGMTVSTNIITNAKPDVLLVPNSALKGQGNGRYIEVPAKDETTNLTTITGPTTLTKPIQRQIVTTGLANDDETEILTGLNENDFVISGTVKASTTPAATSSSQNGVRIPGLPTGGAGGGALRGLGGR